MKGVTLKEKFKLTVLLRGHKADTSDGCWGTGSVKVDIVPVFHKAAAPVPRTVLGIDLDRDLKLKKTKSSNHKLVCCVLVLRIVTPKICIHKRHDQKNFDVYLFTNDFRQNKSTGKLLKPKAKI